MILREPTGSYSALPNKRICTPYLFLGKLPACTPLFGSVRLLIFVRLKIINSKKNRDFWRYFRMIKPRNIWKIFSFFAWIFDNSILYVYSGLCAYLILMEIPACTLIPDWTFIRKCRVQNPVLLLTKMAAPSTFCTIYFAKLPLFSCI